MCDSDKHQYVQELVGNAVYIPAKHHYFCQIKVLAGTLEEA